MNRLTRNVLANAIGSIWGVLLSLVTIPIQIRILGAEAYGLIGFLATMQVLLVVFDLGLPSTIIREVARDTDPARKFSRDLVQTCATIYWVIAIAAGVLFALAAPWIAAHWLNVETIPTAEVTLALQLLAVYAGILWPINIYSATLAGLQQFTTINILRIASSTSSQLGGIIVLLITRQIGPLILWLSVSSLMVLCVHSIVCRRAIPGLSLAPRFHFHSIRRIWRFALDLNLISTLTMVYVQTDRILISALLPLRLLGYYTATYIVARQISTIQEAVNSAVLPALSAKAQSTSLIEVSEAYQRYAQMLLYMVTLPSFILIFFGHNILHVWIGTEIADGGWAAAALLACGFLLNASMSTGYTAAISLGHSRLAVVVNLVGLVWYVPAMFFLTTRFGLEGAALGWVLLNMFYAIIFNSYVQHRILQSSIFGWWMRVVLPFVCVGALCIGTGRILVGSSPSTPVWIVVMAASSLTYIGIGFFLLAPQSRRQILEFPRRMAARLTS